MASTSKTANADAQFKKAQRAEDGKKAMTEYEAEGHATRVKTAKLRALRLARDAELAVAAAAASAAGKKKPAKKAKPKPPAISDFVRDQGDGWKGR